MKHGSFLLKIEEQEIDDQSGASAATSERANLTHNCDISWLEGLLAYFRLPFPHESEDPRSLGFQVGQRVIGLFLTEMLLKYALDDCRRGSVETTTCTDCLRIYHAHAAAQWRGNTRKSCITASLGHGTLPAPQTPCYRHVTPLQKHGIFGNKVKRSSPSVSWTPHTTSICAANWLHNYPQAGRAHPEDNAHDIRILSGSAKRLPFG